MKRNRVFRLLASLTVVVLCMTAFSVTAFAGGGDGDYYTGEPAETTPEPTEEPATGGMEPEGHPLTPEGNACLLYTSCELIMGSKTGLEAIEKTVIDRAVQMIYQPYFADPRPENMPILGDLMNALLSQHLSLIHI